MKPKRRRILLGLTLAAGAVVVALAFWLPDVLSERDAIARYRAIQFGMTRTDVRKLMRDGPLTMYTDINSAEIMHVGGRFMIAVIYESPPGTPASAIAGMRQPGDDWIAKEKIFVDFQRGGRLDDAMVGLGLRSQRLVDRDLAR